MNSEERLNARSPVRELIRAAVENIIRWLAQSEISVTHPQGGSLSWSPTSTDSGEPENTEGRSRGRGAYGRLEEGDE